MKKHLFAPLITLGTLSLLFQLPAQAADYVLKASDPGATSSFTNPFVGVPGNWASTIGGAAVGAPTAGNNYSVNYSGVVNWDLRTPGDANNYTFAGDSLSINAPSGTATANTARFLLLGSAARTITVNNLILNGGYILSSGGNITETLAGNISLNSTTSFGASATGRTLNITAPISGTGTLNFTAGTVILAGANTYSGGTTLNAPAGALTVSGAGTLGSSTASLTVNNSGGVAGPTLNLSTSVDTTVGSLSGSGSSTINGGGGTRIFTVNQTTSGSYAGSIRGGTTSFTLGTLSTGTLTLTGSSAYTGSTTVDAGTLVVGNGTTGSLAGGGNVTVNAGTLGGSLASGNNFAAAVVIGNNIGSADAILSAGTVGTTGRLASGGGLTLKSDAKFVFDLVTTSGLVASDLYIVGGTGVTTIDSGAVFELNAVGDNSGLTLGQTFTAIDGSSFAGSAGVFANVAEGSTISSNGATFQASYLAGDLIFTVVPEPSTWALLVLGFGASLILRRRQGQQTS